MISIRRRLIPAANLIFLSMELQPGAQSATFNTIFSLPSPSIDGRLPSGPLILTKTGNLYGAAGENGPEGGGTVFSLKPPAAPNDPWTQDVIFAVPSPGGEGGAPVGPMSFGADSVLYVATAATGEVGAIYSVTPPSEQGGPWAGEMLYQFTGGVYGSTDGAGPTGVLVGTGGILYGTTTEGGTAQIGTAFQLTPPAQTGAPWTESLIWQFQGGGDGEHPYGALTPGPNGTFYGTTLSGGASDFGTVFQLIPPAEQGGAWSKAVLYSFTGAKDGQSPGSSVIVSANGSLFGTTETGGGKGGGSVYRLNPPAAIGGAWTESVLHGFKGTPTDGAVPHGAVCMGKNGAFFGVTEEGGTLNKGTVFELTPPSAAGEPWTETILHNFSGADGAYPYYGLTLGPSGVLYGTTQTGGPNGNGTIFALTP